MAEETPPQFGRYLVQAKIGEGSMGRVYRAYDPLAKRVVCIKTPRAEILSEDTTRDYLRRFEREARAAGSLSHPNIVTIFDVGEDYFVMELLEGSTLQRILLERGKLSLGEVVRLLDPVAEALDHAHSRGIIHRDVKPGNIHVNAEGRPNIVDFGVAHFESSVLTAKGEFLGSPSYMAPEQIAKSEATAATDIFSLAIVAYEMLTGQKPFQADSITAVIYRVVHEEPPRPSVLNAELPERFDAVFGRALAKEPAARFASAMAFMDALAGRSSVELPATLAASPPPAADSLAVDAVETQDLSLPSVRRGIGRRVALAGVVVLLAGLSYFGFLRPAKATMSVETEPSGSTVLLDGVIVGVSPVAMSELTPGRHAVRVLREGYAPAEVGIELVAGAEAAPIRFTLRPVEAVLTIHSAPGGGSVLVDDQRLGVTPLTNVVKPGIHSVRVERDGYKPWNRDVEARGGQETILEAPLESTARAAASEARPGGWVAEGDLVELGPGVDPPRRLVGSEALYPPEAARLKLQGAVAVDVIVTEKGEVKDPRLAESAGALLDRAVLDAVRGFRFEPAQKNGVKVSVRYTYKQRFP